MSWKMANFFWAPLNFLDVPFEILMPCKLKGQMGPTERKYFVYEVFIGNHLLIADYCQSWVGRSPICSGHESGLLLGKDFKVRNLLIVMIFKWYKIAIKVWITLFEWNVANVLKVLKKIRASAFHRNSRSYFEVSVQNPTYTNGNFEAQSKYDWDQLNFGKNPQSTNGQNKKPPLRKPLYRQIFVT